MCASVTAYHKVMTLYIQIYDDTFAAATAPDHHKLIVLFGC